MVGQADFHCPRESSTDFYQPDKANIGKLAGVDFENGCHEHNYKGTK